MRIVVPHGRVYLALAQLAQQAHTRDVQGGGVPIVCPPNILSEPTKSYGRLLDRALLGKPNSTLGGSRRTNAQESTTQKAHAFVDTRAEDRAHRMRVYFCPQQLASVSFGFVLVRVRVL